MKFISTLRFAGIAALALAVAQPAHAIGSKFYWKKPIRNLSPECKSLNNTIDVRIDVLFDLYIETLKQLRKPGLSFQQRRELRRTLTQLTNRIGIIQMVNFRVDRTPLKPQQCKRLEEKVLKLASFPF